MDRDHEQMKSCPKFAVFVLGVGLTAGCLPIPHTTLRSPEVWGRVLDQRTREPIQGADVSFNQSPHHRTLTDTRGHFHRKAVRNFHFLYLPPEGHWPDRKDSGTRISHPDYAPLWGDWSGDVGDIFLRPKS